MFFQILNSVICISDFPSVSGFVKNRKKCCPEHSLPGPDTSRSVVVFFCYVDSWVQELRSRCNEENSPSYALWGLDQANNQFKPVGLFMSGGENTYFGTWKVFGTFFFPNLTDRRSPPPDPSGQGAGKTISYIAMDWFWAQTVFHPKEKTGSSLVHLLFVLNVSIYLSGMPTKSWIKLRNLEETCKLKLPQSHLLPFIYLV